MITKLTMRKIIITVLTETKCDTENNTRAKQMRLASAVYTVGLHGTVTAPVQAVHNDDGVHRTQMAGSAGR